MQSLNMERKLMMFNFLIDMITYQSPASPASCQHDQTLLFVHLPVFYLTVADKLDVYFACVTFVTMMDICYPITSSRIQLIESYRAHEPKPLPRLSPVIFQYLHLLGFFFSLSERLYSMYPNSILADINELSSPLKMKPFCLTTTPSPI